LIHSKPGIAVIQAQEKNLEKNDAKEIKIK
jgi:hypothetical protein